MHDFTVPCGKKIVIVVPYTPFRDGVNSLAEVVKSTVVSMGTIFVEIWTKVKSTTMDAWNYIKPTIMGAVKEISDFWQDVWPKMKELFNEVWSALEVILAPILAALYIAISATLGFIKGAWHDVWYAIKDAFKLVWDLIVGILRLNWDIVTGIFKIALDILTGHWSDAWNDMKNMLSNIWNDIGKLFSDFVTNALNFGKDLVMGIAHGIEGAIDYVINAAKKVVSAITSVFSTAPTSPSIGGSSATGMQIGRNAGGTDNWEGGLTWVGEQGPRHTTYYFRSISTYYTAIGYVFGYNGTCCNNAIVSNPYTRHDN